MASVEEEAQQAGVSHPMVGSPIGHLCEPVPLDFCFSELGFQVGRTFYVSICWSNDCSIQKFQISHEKRSQ